jgi:ankyrin repeat protein
VFACYYGCGGVVRVLLEHGADPTIANDDGETPMAVAKENPDMDIISAEGRLECVAALEVSLDFSPSVPHYLSF